MGFRADEVELVVREYVEGLMVDPDTIADVLPQRRVHHEQASDSIHDRLTLVKNALVATEWPLEGLLDLYLTEDISTEASRGAPSSCNTALQFLKLTRAICTRASRIRPL